MKKLSLFIIFSFFLISGGNFCYANETSSSSTDGFINIYPTQIKNDLTLKVKETTFVFTPKEIATWILEVNDLHSNSDYLSEIENTDICTYKKSLVCDLLISTQNKTHIQKSSRFFLDPTLIKKSLETLSEKVNKEPTNATLNMKDGKISVFALDQKGITLDIDASISLIEAHFREGSTDNTVNLAYQEKNPNISIDAINNLGITTLLGEGRSNFRGSPKNRIFNIKVATKKFHGYLIKPGEDFSFVGTLGPVDGEHGYLPELVIKNDKTEPEFGGGICQVSTTVFRAAIYSGLEITTRKNHAYPVSYYNPQGMDSTIYIPHPDLRFINNTPGYILMQSEIIGTELIFRFFGTNDGRKVTIDGPHILEKKPDGSMKTVFSQKVTDASDNLIREDVFKSAYDSPSKYPHPGDVIVQKPKEWSKGEWEKYLKENKKT